MLLALIYLINLNVELLLLIFVLVAREIKINVDLAYGLPANFSEIGVW